MLLAESPAPYLKALPETLTSVLVKESHALKMNVC